MGDVSWVMECGWWSMGDVIWVEYGLSGLEVHRVESFQARQPTCSSDSYPTTPHIMAF